MRRIRLCRLDRRGDGVVNVGAFDKRPTCAPSAFDAKEAERVAGSVEN